jgi:hypothetical protein
MTHLNSKNATTATPIDYASIARVASAVELRDIALRSSRAVLHAPAAEIPERWSGEAFVGYDTSVESYESENPEFSIKTAFIAMYKGSWGNEVFAELPKIDPDDPPEIEIEASFELTYLASDPSKLTPEDLKNFAVANGTLHAWPYWREFADDTTQRMHVPRLVVGVFKFRSKHDPGGRGESPAPSAEDEKNSADESAEAKDGGEN